jgi:hypothetical protein
MLLWGSYGAMHTEGGSGRRVRCGGVRHGVAKRGLGTSNVAGFCGASRNGSSRLRSAPRAQHETQPMAGCAHATAR